MPLPPYDCSITRAARIVKRFPEKFSLLSRYEAVKVLSHRSVRPFPSLLDQMPVFCQHISLRCKPSKLDTGSSDKCDALIADCVMIRIHNIAKSIFVADAGCEFNILIFPIPAFSGCFLSPLNCLDCLSKIQNYCPFLSFTLPSRFPRNKISLIFLPYSRQA